MKIKMNLGGQSIKLDVPEGMDPGEYAEQVAERHASQEDYSAASESGLENFRAGIGRGIVNPLRQIGNIAGAISDEDMAQYDAQDKDLLDTKAGTAGNLVGELAITAPIGMGVGAGASRAASMAPNVLTRALASPAGVAALDNAATGALVAGPGNRMEGAATGAAVSGVMSGAGKVLKKTLMEPWVSKLQSAKDLENMTGHNIPLSQSAEPGIWKQIYEGVVANVPGAGGKLRGQYDKALQDFREFVVEEATPPGMNRVPTVGGHDMQKIMGDLKSAWDTKYGSFTINQYPINFDVDVPKGLYRRLPEGVKVPKRGTTVMGSDMMTLRQTVQDVIDELPEKERVLKSQLTAFKDDLWKNLKDDIDPTGKGRTPGGKELKEYEALAPYYKKYMDIVKAAQSAIGKSSEFSPEQLAKATNSRAGSAGVSGGGGFSQEARLASEALKPFPSRQGIFQTNAALGTAAGLGGAAALGATVGGPVGAVIGVGLPIAAGRALANPNVQRALAGELPGQRRIAAAIRAKKGPLKKAARLAGRAATISMAED